eukprot:TRINITY_DN34868_c0_g1_i1.p2 TRINITY_DN34868_c0_g1~~TRINITY_DN34868_c0_g1_i1.p2  ORF type:complete len:195 (+),score=-11.57 TRINITY_DN34868_c0_g1_i1:771-1355(+)
MLIFCFNFYCFAIQSNKILSESSFNSPVYTFCGQVRQSVIRFKYPFINLYNKYKKISQSNQIAIQNICKKFCRTILIINFIQSTYFLNCLSKNINQINKHFNSTAKRCRMYQQKFRNQPQFCPRKIIVRCYTKPFFEQLPGWAFNRMGRLQKKTVGDYIFLCICDAKKCIIEKQEYNAQLDQSVLYVEYCSEPL